MIGLDFARRRGRAAALLFLAAACAGLAAAAEYKPEVGQEGKDVVWVPTPEPLVEKMLELAQVTAQDYVIDLGSGDGRTVIAAAKRGARALGIEYNPEMVKLSERNARQAGVAGRARFVQGDIFESDFSQATVLTLFLLPELNLKLRPKILALKPGTRIVSNSFDMGDWEPDRKVTLTEADGCRSYCTALLWIVPARVEGTWKLAEGELRLKQTFQKIEGTLASAGVVYRISNGRLNGERIRFEAGGARYEGRVSGEAMEGLVKGAGGSKKWAATRAAQPS
jgi:SAM-dependent methyltransferase